MGLPHRTVVNIVYPHLPSVLNALPVGLALGCVIVRLLLQRAAYVSLAKNGSRKFERS